MAGWQLALGLMLALGIRPAAAQLRLLPIAGPAVYRAGDTLHMAWAGGMNNPQFSMVDLNVDGQLDLIAYDRADRSLIPMRAVPQGNVLVYRHAPEYLAAFPPLDSLGAWVLMRDWDGDGDMDLFTDRNANVHVYRNTGLPGSRPLTFEQLRRGTTGPNNDGIRLLSKYSGFRTYLYAASVDISGIEDVDFDGDLDFLVYDVLGTEVEFHKNFARERYQRADTFDLEAVTTCFGRFSRYYDAATRTFTVVLNRPPCIGEQKTNGPNHAGATVLPLNLNGDTLTDLIVGEVDVPYLVSVTNHGSRAKAIMTEADTSFPGGNVPVFQQLFPAAYYVDADLDGIRDLLVAPNAEGTSEDRKCVLYYRNHGPDDFPDFRLQSDSFLVSQMLDVGTGAAPCFADVNADGKLDLLIGNRSQYLTTTTTRQQIALYHNTGTSQAPVYQWVSDDFLGFATTPGLTTMRSLSPAWGDVDSDGKPDLLIGEEMGRLIYYRNTAPAGTAAQYQLVSTDYLGASALGLRRFAPAIQDIDGDGLQDLVIGTNRGRLLFYQNTGTPGQPNFTLRSRTWGQVTTIDPTLDNFSGNARPLFVDLNHDNRPELLVGALNGRIYIYDSYSADTVLTFVRTDSLGPRSQGRDVRPAAYRIPGSDTVFFALGTLVGGLRAALLPLPPDTATTARAAEPAAEVLRLYPNPARDYVRLELPGPGLLNVLDVQGRLIARHTLYGSRAELRTADWAPGVYTLQWQSPTGRAAWARLLHIVQP